MMWSRAVLFSALLWTASSFHHQVACNRRWPAFRATTAEEASVGERISTATSAAELLAVEPLLIHPGEETKVHQHQLVHQRKRQRHATSVLARLVKYVIGVEVNNERGSAVASEAFRRLVVCATAGVGPSGHATPWVDEDTDVASYVECVRALGALAPLPEACLAAARPLFEHFDAALPRTLHLSPAKLSAVEWAGRRLFLSAEYQGISAAHSALKLPFRVLHALAKDVVSLDAIKKEVKFKQDLLTTRDGRTVSERRETCWMADPGIGGLSYSGKIMIPFPFTESIARVRDVIEAETGIYYDCCLINHYADGECACKYHSDPEHGTYWAYDTVVVSIGETRRFNLRAIGGAGEQEPHSFHLYSGDVFYMFRDCQDAFQHAVLKSENAATNNAPRASIVFKMSLPGPGGRRGHGLSKNQPAKPPPAGRPTSAPRKPRSPPGPRATKIK